MSATAWGKLALGVLVFCSGPTASGAAETVPYRARYALSLVSAATGSGVTGAHGFVIDQWTKTCEGWRERQHIYLHVEHDADDREQNASDTYSNIATLEAQDASWFRFNVRRASTDEDDAFEQTRGVAQIGAAGAGGLAAYMQP